MIYKKQRRFLKLPDKEGKVTITIKVDSDETDEIKEGNSFRTSANFTTIEQLHEKVDLLCINLKKKIAEKFVAKFTQPKLTEEVEATV